MPPILGGLGDGVGGPIGEIFQDGTQTGVEAEVGQEGRGGEARGPEGVIVQGKDSVFKRCDPILCLPS